MLISNEKVFDQGVPTLVLRLVLDLTEEFLTLWANTDSGQLW